MNDIMKIYLSFFRCSFKLFSSRAYSSFKLWNSSCKN